MKRTPWIVFALGMSLCVGLGSGCAKLSNQQGVDNLWRSADTPEFVSGTTTQQDVLDALGPPSQILDLGDRLAFYYLREFGRGDAMLFLIYNSRKNTVGYDRAVFFFDPEGLLTDFSYSAEQAPRP